MKAGPLRHQVTIRKKAVTRNSIGEEIVTWTTHADVWAEIQPLRGREYMDIRAAQSEITTRIRMRFVEGVTSAMQVLHGSTAYAIVEVINENSRDRMLELMCVTT